MTEQFEIKNTKALQLKSVAEFMLQLGYGMSANGSFEDYLHRPYGTGKNHISFRSAVMLHNEGNLDNNGKVYERFGFDLYSFEKSRRK